MSDAAKLSFPLTNSVTATASLDDSRRLLGPSGLTQTPVVTRFTAADFEDQYYPPVRQYKQIIPGSTSKEKQMHVMKRQQRLGAGGWPTY